MSDIIGTETLALFVRELSLRRVTCEKPNQDQSAAYDFDNAYKRSHNIRRWDADFRKSSHSRFSGKEKLLNAFAKKHGTHYQAN